MAKMAKMMGFSRGVDVMRVSSAGRSIDGRRTERHGGCTGLRSFVRGRRGATATAFASTSPAVLLTREESKNDKLRALLEGRGYETFELPLVEHTRNEGGRADLVHELAGGEGRVDWFITTSPEAAVVFTVSSRKPSACSALKRSRASSLSSPLRHNSGVLAGGWEPALAQSRVDWEGDYTSPRGERRRRPDRFHPVQGHRKSSRPGASLFGRGRRPNCRLPVERAREWRRRGRAGLQGFSGAEDQHLWNQTGGVSDGSPGSGRECGGR